MDDNQKDIQLQQAVDSIVGGNAESLSPADVEALTDRYPYFTIPAAQLLKSRHQELSPDLRKRLITRVALSTTNPTDLYMLLEPDNESHARFYPDTTPKRPTTENAIERFFDNFATTSPEEEELLNRLIFNPTPDYAQILAAEDAEDVPIASDAEPGSDDDRINRFILANRDEIVPPVPAAVPVAIKEEQETVPQEIPAEEQASTETKPTPETKTPAETKPTPEDKAIPEAKAPAETKTPSDSLLSESLARIFVRQRQYERAYEIIEQLNLNFPEKSVYFADQLRFLRKLINYERLKNGR